MAATFSILDWVTSNGLTYTGNLTGEALKVLRVNAGETGFELAVDGGVGAVNATLPIIASGTTTRTLSIPGLTGFGAANQVVVNLGTAWGYQSTTGTGNIVREGSPTFTGTITAAAATLSGLLAANAGIETTSVQAESISLNGSPHPFIVDNSAASFGVPVTFGGAVAVSGLGGTAFRMVQASSDGTLSTLGIGAAGQALRLNSGATGWEYFTPMVGDVTAVTGTAPIVVTSGTGPIPNVTIAGLTTVGTGGQLPMSDGSAWFYIGSTGSSTVVRSTSPTFNTSIIFNGSGTIRSNTSDGSDTGIIGIYGGGGATQTRGAFIEVLGNEFGSSLSGAIIINAGNVSDGKISFRTGGLERATIGNDGSLALTGNLGFFSENPVSQRTLTEWTDTAFANPVTQTSTFNGQMSNLITWIQSMQAGLGNNTGYGLLNLT